MHNVIAVDFCRRERLPFGSLALKLSEPVQPKDWYEELIERVRARFGENQPKLLDRAVANEWLAPYRFGCVHNISYKGASKFAACKRAEWNRPTPFPTRVKFNTKVLGKNVELGADPLPWMDLKYRTAWRHIQARQGHELTIRTRSDLIAHDDYIEVLDRENHFIEIIITTGVDDDIIREYEPGAPSNNRRRKAYEKLKTLGYNVKLVPFNVSKLIK